MKSSHTCGAAAFDLSITLRTDFRGNDEYPRSAQSSSCLRKRVFETFSENLFCQMTSLRKVRIEESQNVKCRIKNSERFLLRSSFILHRCLLGSLTLSLSHQGQWQEVSVPLILRLRSATLRTSGKEPFMLSVAAQRRSRSMQICP